MAVLKAASALNWSAIDATIFGTLFERGLDPAKRSQLGANFTDPATIMRLVEPVVQRPLLAEWAGHRLRIEAALAKSKKHGDKAWRDAQAAFIEFLERLKAYRVLDPACGSGNFLYLALKTLKDIEHQVNLEAEQLGLERQHDVTGPHNVLGIELNEYAAELARVTVWIGELQWRIQRGYGFKTHPRAGSAGPHRMPRRGAGGGWKGSGVAACRCGVGKSAVCGGPQDDSRVGRNIYSRAANCLFQPCARRCRLGLLLVRART